MKNRKIIAFLFIILLHFGFISNNIYAKVNENYLENEETTDYDADENGESLLVTISEVVMPIIFPIFTTIANISKVVMYIFTEKYIFPWADNIIFNKIAFLDVNFINPAPYSLFMDNFGEYTMIGNAVRNVYFTILSICLGFLGIAVAFNVIKLLFSTIATNRAKYKELINSTFLTIILLFGMHYLISFVFYINEQLVSVASNITTKVINSDDIIKANENMRTAEDKDNEKILENFFKDCNHTSILSPITIIKKFGKETFNFLKNLWDAIFGEKGDDKNGTYTVGEDDKGSYYDEVFPSKNDFINYFHDESKVGKNGVDIAAYLLKNYDYRKNVLPMVAGNDTNRFSESGLWGTLTSIANTVVWGTGIIDTGLAGLNNLYDSTAYIYNKINISSKAEYDGFVDTYAKIANDPSSSEGDVLGAKIMRLYYEAAYIYVYDGDDKEDVSASDIIGNLGEYFYRNSYYTDVENGQWSPTTFSVIPAILYCVFVLQSFMFLFSYIKRMLYVVILALLGPVTVVYDYLFKTYN